LTKYFRIYQDQFNRPNTYFVKVIKGNNDLYTIRNVSTGNDLFEDITEYEKNRLLENWIEYNKSGIKQLGDLDQ
jgi:hypothetical protein